MARDRVLPTSLITLHILAVTVVLCSTFTAVFAAVGDSCNDMSPCPETVETCSSTNLCTCKSDYYNNNGSCEMSSTGKHSTDIASTTPTTSTMTTTATTTTTSVPKRTYNETCSQDEPCMTGLNCSNGICICNSSSLDLYYNTSSDSCQQKVWIGDPCTETIQCINTSSCESGTCQCPDTDYSKDNMTCVSIKNYTQACTPGDPDEQCAGNLICENSVCGCAAGNYYHMTDNTCKPIKNYTEACIPADDPDEQCAGNLVCVNSFCNCTAGNYYSTIDNTCEPIKNYTQACTPGDPDEQCAGNLVCVNSVCNCTAGNYYSTTDKTCKPIKNYTQACTPGDSDEQCAGNLVCVNSFCGCTAGNYYSTTDKTCKPKVAHGNVCDASISENVCIDPTTTCVLFNGQTHCLCGSDFYYSPTNNTCQSLDKLKVTFVTLTATTSSVALTWTTSHNIAEVTYQIQSIPTGGQTDPVSPTGGTVKGLKSKTSYSFTVTSVLPPDNLYLERKAPAVSNSVWTKIPHAETCTPNAQPICEDGNIACRTTSEFTGYRCLCQSDYYRNVANTSCNPLDELKVFDILAEDSQRFPNNITLTWKTSVHHNEVRYTIQPSDGISPVSDIQGITAAVTGLTAGKQYNFTITPFLPAVGYYPRTNVNSTTSFGIWTKPAKPGAVTGSQLVSEDPIVFDISFDKSQGQVSHYTMTVNSKPVPTTGSATTVRFTNLEAGQSYNYSITAYNGNNDSSEPSTGTLTTPVIASGPVDSLYADNVTSDSATVYWKKPPKPNGNITGYTLTIKEGSTCVYHHIISCSDCTPSPTMSTVDCQKHDIDSQTSEHLNGDTTFSVDIGDLEPYRNYTFRVTAENAKGTGTTDDTPPFRTLAAAARDVTNVSATSARNSDMGPVSLTVKWTPGYFTGPTQYLVTLKEEDGIDLETSTKTYERIVEGYNNDTVTWTDVRAYWNYQVSVLAMTNAGNSSNAVGSKPSPVQTVTTVPGPPESVSVKQNDTVAQELALTVTCPDKEKRNGRITGYVIRKTLLNAEGEMNTEHAVNVDLSKTCEETYTAKDVGGIKVEHNYTFAVRVRNTDYNSTYYKMGDILFVEPKVPRFEEILESYKVPLVKEQSGSTSSETEIDVSVCASCLLDGRQGTVTKVGLVVCKVGPDDQCIDGGRKKRSGVQFEDYTTWKSSHDQNFKYIYRTTPDDWMSTLTSPNTSYPYKIGTDANCRTSADTEYCNGPLPADTVFRVTVIQCNSEGCVIGTFEGPFRTGAEEEPTPVGAIVGGVVAVLVAAAVVAGVAFFLLRRRRGRPTRTSNPIWDIDNQSKQNVPPPVSRPIRIRDFKDEVTKMHKDCNLMFQDQFEDIKKLSAELNATTNEAQREGNRVKNRYVDILPYDHSRVKLSTTPDDDETMDFINANYIAGYSSVREYIATQGPMHCTIPDFWRMAWEQNCRVIVMLSDLQENGKRKVGLYWPENLNDPINYGTVVVEMTNFSQLNKYIIRNFVVKKGNETRKMTHFFLPGWWDFSANLTFDDVLEFAKLVRQEATPHTDGPIIVHCSAGVGRTGTLIALDYFMQFIDKHSLDDTIDVYKFVLEMRKNRPRMVQAETQYIFIFDALVEVIQNKIKAEEERLYDNCGQGNNIYANVGNKQEENIYANTGKDAYVYNNEAFEPEYQNMEMKSQDKTEKPTTEL